MTVVRKEITIDAPRDAVWRYLEDPDLLAAWLMPKIWRGVKRVAAWLARPFRRPAPGIAPPPEGPAS